jgi:SP family general alpha glucoside:H+ symporter-like MFS transporter
MADIKSTPLSGGAPPKDEAVVPTPRDHGVVAVEAKHASDKEHQMSLFQAIKLYPKAIGWSVLVSSTIIMEGYDLALLGNLYASPVFNKKFGQFDAAAGKYVISAAWQSGLSNGARAGEILGLIFAGWTSDRYGYKITTIGSLIMMICFIFVLFFAPNVQVLVAGEVLCGEFNNTGSSNETCNINSTAQEFRGGLFRA